jgi:CIC family chloride channel protein
MFRTKHIDWLKKPSNLLKLQLRLNLPKDFYMISLAALVGIVGGFALVLYHFSIEAVNHLFFNTIADSLPEIVGEYFPILIPALGGILIATLFLYVKRYEKEYGAPAIMDSVVNNSGYMPNSLPIVTFIASVLCIATGGSVGKEGPSILIGAGIASFIGQRLKLSGDRLRLLVGAGAATGLAAAFNVPIAGAIFALEIIMADFSIRAFSPIIIASVFSTTISRMYVHSKPIFFVDEYKLQSPVELFLYLLLGLIGGYLAVFLIRSFRWWHTFFSEKVKLPTFWKPVAGGLIVGLSGYFYPEIYGFDDNVINVVLRDNYGMQTLLILFLLKMLMTNITLASGGIGGFFMPVLLIGALYGLIFGHIVNYFFPEFTAPPGAYAVVGMAVLTSGVQHAMLSSILLIFECTNDYQIMLPLMIGVVPAITISQLINKDSIYTMQFKFWGDRIARGRNVEIMEKMKITTVLIKDVETIGESTPLLGIINKFMTSNAITFPVVRGTHELLGTISLRDIREVMFDESVQALIIAHDLAKTDIVTIDDDENFEQAFEKMDFGDFDSLPVVEKGGSKLIGIVTRDDMMKRYRKELLFTGSNSA